MNELYLEDLDIELEVGQSIIRIPERCSNCGERYTATYAITSGKPTKLSGKCYKCEFKLNVNDPMIRPLYERYKKWKGLSPSYPLTDEQRYEFENYVLKSNKKITGS